MDNEENWYAVKLLFEAIIEGEQVPEDKTYEERIYLIYAESFEEAYEKAEAKAREDEIEYLNTSGETVKWIYASPVDCFHIFDSEIKDKTEVYSRQFTTSEGLELQEVLNRYFPKMIDEADEAAGDA